VTERCGGAHDVANVLFSHAAGPRSDLRRRGSTEGDSRSEHVVRADARVAFVAEALTHLPASEEQPAPAGMSFAMVRSPAPLAPGGETALRERLTRVSTACGTFAQADGTTFADDQALSIAEKRRRVFDGLDAERRAARPKRTTGRSARARTFSERAWRLRSGARPEISETQRIKLIFEQALHSPEHRVTELPNAPKPTRGQVDLREHRTPKSSRPSRRVLRRHSLRGRTASTTSSSRTST
jgi:hypothetical protein